MGLTFIGRGLVVGGLFALVLSAAPAVLLSLLPAALSNSFFGTLGALLLLTVTPLSAVAVSVGVLLLLLGWLARRGRG